MASEIPDNESPAGKGYLIRHWRGQLELAQSFWVNYGIFYVFIFSTAWWLLQNIAFKSFRMLAMFLAAQMFLQMAAFVWMAVGSWRAAGNWIHRTGRQFWAWAARGVLILHLAVLGVVVAPNFILMSVIAGGLDPFNTYKVVRTDSHEVLVQGRFGSNLPGDLAAVLDRAPEIEWVRFESEGGRIGAAREIANMIKTRGLKIRVWEKCLSACFVPLMAADVRALSRKARVGLHGYVDPGGFGFLIDDEMELDRRYLVSRGVSNTFLDKAFSTPPDDMWYPSFDELVEGGVVTHVMEDGETRPVRPE